MTVPSHPGVDRGDRVVRAHPRTPLGEVPTVEFPLRTGTVLAIRDVSFTLDEGERVGIVGESGAGKSVCAFAILNLVSKPGLISGGRILFQGRELAGLEESRRWWRDGAEQLPR